MTDNKITNVCVACDRGYCYAVFYGVSMSRLTVLRANITGFRSLLVGWKARFYLILCNRSLM